MQLWIAEKPSVAKAICAELGIVKKGAGFNECKGGNTVTWCFGHLLEQAGPDAYTPDDVPVTKKGGKIWRMQDLPIFPSVWKLNVKSKPSSEPSKRCLLRPIVSSIAATRIEKDSSLLMRFWSFINAENPSVVFGCLHKIPRLLKKA